MIIRNCVIVDVRYIEMMTELSKIIENFRKKVWICLGTDDNSK